MNIQMHGGLNMPMYRCWGEDHEDLTEQVQRAKQVDNSIQMITPRSFAKTREPRKWRVRVKCSKGHMNIFEGQE
jgi:hypothetical protein